MLECAHRVLLFGGSAGFAFALRPGLEALGFEVAGVVAEYPGRERLAVALAHFRADSIFLEVEGAAQAKGVLEDLRAAGNQAPVICCATAHRPEAVLELLRAGAFDYVAAPYENETLSEVGVRLWKHQQRVSPKPAKQAGRVVGFASGKPGSGATTLATQTAFALKKLGERRVLLVDLNLYGGTTSRWAGPTEEVHSVVEAMEQLETLERASDWAPWTHAVHGVCILPAPVVPETLALPEERIADLLRAARRRFDFVVVDLPAALDGLTSAVAGELDELLMATTTELASLHVTKRALPVLSRTALPATALQVVLNRTRKSDVLPVAELEKMLGMRIQWTVPNDYFTLHAAGELALVGESALVVAIRKIAAGLIGSRNGDTPQRPREAEGGELAWA